MWECYVCHDSLIYKLGTRSRAVSTNSQTATLVQLSHREVYMHPMASGDTSTYVHNNMVNS